MTKLTQNSKSILSAQTIASYSDVEIRKAIEEVGTLPADRLALKIEQTQRDTLSRLQTINVFDLVESVNAIKSEVDIVRAAILLSNPVEANEVISAEKARLTMINRSNRSKRLAKIVKLNDYQLALISANTSAEQIESTAIYAVDKIIQLAAFLTGNKAVFRNGKNNTLAFTLRAIAQSNGKTTTADIKVALEKAGQPDSSSQTQASSSLKALQTMNCLFNTGSGRYEVNGKSALMTSLLSMMS